MFAWQDSPITNFNKFNKAFPKERQHAGQRVLSLSAQTRWIGTRKGGSSHLHARFKADAFCEGPLADAAILLDHSSGYHLQQRQETRHA